MKILDVLQSPSLSNIITELNKLEVQKEDLVAIFPPREAGLNYVAIFYYIKK